MRQLLMVAHTDIKMGRRPSTASPLRRFQLIKFSVRTMKFLMGEHFAESFRSLIFWLLRGFSSSRKKPKAERKWETRERNFPEL